MKDLNILNIVIKKKLSNDPKYACSSGSYPSIANRALNSPKNISNGVALLQMSPKRGLLKKSSISNDVAANNSEYDVRSGAIGLSNRTSGEFFLSNFINFNSNLIF